MLAILGGSIFATGCVLVTSTLESHDKEWKLLLHRSADSRTIRKTAAAKSTVSLIVEGVVEPAGDLPLLFPLHDSLITQRRIHKISAGGRTVLMRSDESSVSVLLNTRDLQLQLAPTRSISLPVHVSETFQDESRQQLIVHSSLLPAHSAVAVIGSIGFDGDRLVLRGSHVVAARRRRWGALRLLPSRVWAGSLLVASGAAACIVGLLQLQSRS